VNQWFLVALLAVVAALGAATAYAVVQTRAAERKTAPAGRFLDVDGVRSTTSSRGKATPSCSSTATIGGSPPSRRRRAEMHPTCPGHVSRLRLGRMTSRLLCSPRARSAEFGKSRVGRSHKDPHAFTRPTSSSASARMKRRTAQIAGTPARGVRRGVPVSTCAQCYPEWAAAEDYCHLGLGEYAPGVHHGAQRKLARACGGAQEKRRAGCAWQGADRWGQNRPVNPPTHPA
jgi:hypothetical protein